MNKILQIGIIALLLVALVSGVNAEPVTWIEDDRKITVDEEAGTILIEPYQTPLNKFLSFFSISPPLTVVPQDTVKKNVAEFYRVAGENRWTRNMIHVNQKWKECGYYDPSDCPPGLHEFVDGSVLCYGSFCSDMPQSQKDVLSTLQFGLRDNCFVCMPYPGGGGSGYSYCHIQSSGRELTPDELWLTDLKPRALDLGYDIRSSSATPIGWGFYSASGECWDAYMAFAKETGVGGSGRMVSYGGGKLCCITSMYAYTMASITQPLCEPWAERCKGNNLEQCNSEGSGWIVMETCEFGCNEVAGACNLCEEGSEENYTCSDGTEAPWCICQKDEWVCITSPEIGCPPPQKKMRCNGDILEQYYLNALRWMAVEDCEFGCNEAEGVCNPCEEGSEKKYVCHDDVGTEVPWCVCEGGEWICIESPELGCPLPDEKNLFGTVMLYLEDFWERITKFFEKLRG